MRIFLLSTLFLLAACSGTEEKQIKSENDVDAARNFIRAALDGKWDAAKGFMLQDSTNLQLLGAYESRYQTHMSAADKEGYRSSSITFYDTRQVNDSTSIIKYSNSYKKQKDSLRILRLNNQWVVDFKFLFPQTDTSGHVH